MSTKHSGCFFCKGKAKSSRGVCDSCGRPVDIEPLLKNISFDGLTFDSVIGRGFYGWTLKMAGTFQLFAVKLIPLHRARPEKLLTGEAEALAACSPHNNIAKFWTAKQLVISLGSEEVSVLALFFEFVPEAIPLRLFCEDREHTLSRTDAYGILAGIAAGLARLHGRNLWHDDLHDDNILIRKIADDEITEGRYEAKLIDFGSCKRRLADMPEPAGRSDYYYLSKHVDGLASHFETINAKRLTPADRFFANRLRILALRLADINVSRRQLDPRDLITALRKALDDATSGQLFPPFSEMLAHRQISFRDPFDNTNALYLAPQDITRLFRDSLGWVGRIDKSEPVLVVGPRGCGKTMLLRYHSLEAQARPLGDETTVEVVKSRLAKQPYLGFLVSVSQLRTPFLRSAYKRLTALDPTLAEDFTREYINGHFVFEVLRTVLWLRKEALADITDDDLALLTGLVGSLVPTGRLLSTGLGGLEQTLEIVEDRVRSMSNLKRPKDYVPLALASDDILARLASALRSTRWVSRKEIWFLLDDYSLSLLPALAIKAYNPVLFRPSAELRIKVSSEGEGPTFDDTLARKYKEGRELWKINLGEIYFQTSEDKGRKFFHDILSTRFSETASHYTMTYLQDVIGVHEHLRNFGRYIKETFRAGDVRFYGLDVLFCLCSGDVSFIIELLNELVKKADKKGKRLTATEQDDLIKRYAHRQLNDLKSISDFGPKLFAFAYHLGELLRDYLVRSPTGADQRLRVEIEGTGELPADEQIFHDALLRHSVLVPGGAGKSQAGLPTRKLFFRRLYAPCFPFSPLRKGSIALTVQQYAAWLSNPSNIAPKSVTRKRVKAHKSDTQQPTLPL